MLGPVLDVYILLLSSISSNKGLPHPFASISLFWPREAVSFRRKGKVHSSTPGKFEHPSVTRRTNQNVFRKDKALCLLPFCWLFFLLAPKQPPFPREVLTIHSKPILQSRMPQNSIFIHLKHGASPFYKYSVSNKTLLICILSQESSGYAGAGGVQRSDLQTPPMCTQHSTGWTQKVHTQKQSSVVCIFFSWKESFKNKTKLQQRSPLRTDEDCKKLSLFISMFLC